MNFDTYNQAFIEITVVRKYAYLYIGFKKEKKEE